MKYFCDFSTIDFIKKPAIGNIINDINVICQLIENIITSIPIIVQIDVIICVILWFKFMLNVSISFVITDKISPLVLLSKYFIGNLFIFIAISFLNLYVIFWDTVVIAKPCIIENIVLIIYNPNKINAICPIFPKSIPAPPVNFPINPLNISVVAFPNILGPTMVNIVLPIANNITKNIATLYFER